MMYHFLNLSLLILALSSLAPYLIFDFVTFLGSHFQLWHFWAWHFWFWITAWHLTSPGRSHCCRGPRGTHLQPGVDSYPGACWSLPASRWPLYVPLCPNWINGWWHKGRQIGELTLIPLCLMVLWASQAFLNIWMVYGDCNQ